MMNVDSLAELPRAMPENTFCSVKGEGVYKVVNGAWTQVQRGSKMFVHSNIMTDAEDTRTLQEMADDWMKAGQAYWDKFKEEMGRTAVVWVKDTSGAMCIFTRGEYSKAMLDAIDGPIKERTFGHVDGD